MESSSASVSRVLARLIVVKRGDFCIIEA